MSKINHIPSGLKMLLGVGIVVLLASRWLSDVEAKGHDDKVLQGLDCNACHNTDSWRLSDRASEAGGFDHDKTGFPLTGEHGKHLCTACHAPKRKVTRDCYSCHRDQHRGKLGRQCESCHNSKSWLDTSASKKHRLTRLPLTGMHAVLDCSSCHLRTSAKKYLPVPADCFACHEDDYRGDIHPNHTGTMTSAPFSRVCSQCHQTSGWTPAFIRSGTNIQASALRSDIAITHDQVFVLSYGPHRDASCKSCHRRPSKPRSATCQGCHVHNKLRLQRQHKGRVPTSALSCLGCHPQGRNR